MIDLHSIPQTLLARSLNSLQILEFDTSIKNVRVCTTEEGITVGVNWHELREQPVLLSITDEEGGWRRMGGATTE